MYEPFLKRERYVNWPP
ncbi:rCG29135 [Rattus norvegicus]|uniref:RCG29135 n=1 Tax=Rattus norvegicus TaxID=10116 RepID=A6KRP1_RAT|nr:rCG29135 [Rattus norvegicus]